MDPSKRAPETPAAGDTMSDDVAPRSVSVDALRLLKCEIEREVAVGLSGDDKIVRSSVDWVLMNFDEDEAALNWHGERIFRAAMAEHARQQATWPLTTDCHRLDAAFAELEEAGILCRQDFTLEDEHGQEEMQAEIDDEEKSGVRIRGFTYFSMQAVDEVLAGGKLRLQFGVGEGSAEEAEDIGLDVARALHRHGLKVIWDGKAETPILVDMVWRKRRADGPLSGANKG
jgi:hypothetical protein